MIWTGCEGMDAVRANSVALEVDGRLFRSNPDTAYVIGTDEPDQILRQHDDYFTFGLCEKLYSKNRERLVLNLVFMGNGIIELDRRYPLHIPEEGEIGYGNSYIVYGGGEHEVSDGWVEFSEFGVNDDGDRAYVSGIFGITLKDSSLKVSNGTFGRMLECEYYCYKSPEI